MIPSHYDRFSKVASLVLAAATGFAEPVAAQGENFRLNLPQRELSIALPNGLRSALQAALEPAPAAPAATTKKTASTEPALPPALQQDLIRSLPEDFRNSCAAMHESWGEIAHGKSHWTARVLWYQRDFPQTRVLLAFRCSSSYSEYAKYFDERPALVILGNDSGTLRLFPLAPDAPNDSALFHLSFQKAFAAEGANLLALRFKKLEGANPCCDGSGYLEDSDHLNFLRIPDAQSVLAIVQRSWSSNHDDEKEQDEETLCRTQILPVRNKSGLLREIWTTTRCTEGKKPKPATRRNYRWNPSTLKFHETKPL